MASLTRRGFEPTLGDGEERESLVCCRPWGLHFFLQGIFGLGDLWILESTYSSFGGCSASFPEVTPKAAYFEWWPEEEKA